MEDQVKMELRKILMYAISSNCEYQAIVDFVISGKIDTNIDEVYL